MNSSPGCVNVVDGWLPGMLDVLPTVLLLCDAGVVIRVVERMGVEVVVDVEVVVARNRGLTIYRIEYILNQY